MWRYVHLTFFYLLMFGNLITGYGLFLRGNKNPDSNIFKITDFLGTWNVVYRNIQNKKVTFAPLPSKNCESVHYSVDDSLQITFEHLKRDTNNILIREKKGVIHIEEMNKGLKKWKVMEGETPFIQNIIYFDEKNKKWMITSDEKMRKIHVLARQNYHINTEELSHVLTLKNLGNLTTFEKIDSDC